MTQKPPFSSPATQLEMTDPAVQEDLSDEELDQLDTAETTPTLMVRKSKLSEDEIRLGEEAFLNALIEIEELSKTAAQAGNERAENERHIRSEIEDLRRTQGQRIEEAHNERAAAPEQLRKDQALYLEETPQRAEESEPSKEEEEGLRSGEDFVQSSPFAESFKGDADFTPVPSQTPRTGVDLQGEDFDAVVTDQPSEKGIARFGEDLDIPVDVIDRLNSASPIERSSGLKDLARVGGEDAFHIIARAFDEESEDLRNAAALALFDLQPDRVESFARTLREASSERRQRIGSAFVASGLAASAIGNLAGQTREKGYEAFSLLFLMTKAGEVQPLVRAIEEHPNVEVRLAVVKLLALNGEAGIVPYFRQLAVRGVLPSEVRGAVIEAIYELARQVPRSYTSGAKG